MFRYGHMYGHMGFWPGRGGNLMFFIWIIIIGVAVYLLLQRNSNNKNNNYQQDHSINKQQNSSQNDAEELARARYARGEISKEEFEEIIATLRK